MKRNKIGEKSVILVNELAHAKKMLKAFEMSHLVFLQINSMDVKKMLLIMILLMLAGPTMPINYCMNYLPYCDCRSSERIECTNFDSFDSLDFKQPIKKKMSNLKQYYLMKIEPKSALKFDHSFSLNHLNLDMNKFQFILNNIKTFELTANPFHNHSLLASLAVISINNSSFSFVYRGNQFNWLCDLVIKDSQLNPVFSSFKSLYLGYSSSVDFSSPICPAIFKNSNLDSLFMTNLSVDNMPSFISVHDPDISVNSRIRSLHIQSSQIGLDTSLLDKHVFKYTQKISIEFSNLTHIQTNVFTGLAHLRHINLWLFNFDHLIHSIGLEWLNGLNHELKLFYDANLLDQEFKKMKAFVLKKQVTIEFRDESGSYGYPEQDFCKFKNFPHSRLVFPLIQSNAKLNCTCTMLWLLQFWRFANMDMRTSSVESCFNGATIFDLLVIRCRFSDRLRLCANGTRQSGSNGSRALSAALTLLKYF
ncbi:hypothetical protein BpHYR1_016171 [Brachionus plicatilis]|uniref:Uncharacterized protein n=1 Tax=Brachionus plicatilis TaxID=10195 RepID=A0A3M7P4U1_BRAPC|nr:hypothetical protein BpHYR1_016171 [Brachionus plicatilis]